jgi:hypothetical protein
MNIPGIRILRIVLEHQNQQECSEESLVRSGTGMNSAMTEEKLLKYLRYHQGLQHIGVVANVNSCSVARVLELSMDLRKRGLIQIRAYPSGFHLQTISWSETFDRSSTD